MKEESIAVLVERLANNKEKISDHESQLKNARETIHNVANRFVGINAILEESRRQFEMIFLKLESLNKTDHEIIKRIHELETDKRISHGMVEKVETVFKKFNVFFPTAILVLLVASPFGRAEILELLKFIK